MATGNVRIESNTAAEGSAEKPHVPAGKVLVKAVHRGFWNGTDVEPGECFLISVEPLNQETGLPKAYSDHRKPVKTGFSGWMKPADSAEEKKLLDIQAAFKKGLKLPASAVAQPNDGALKDENQRLRERVAELEKLQASGSAPKAEETKTEEKPADPAEPVAEAKPAPAAPKPSGPRRK